jgi:predicted house-cleaning noncanonical NTP pyrophosphatase (MazG superfamily)
MEFVPTSHPVENEYPKLVRDNIPDIIKERTGVSPEQRIASDDAEFESFLLKKVVEEAIELQHSGEHDNLGEEIADINEIIQTLMQLREKKAEEIAAIQKEKREKNGGFEKRIIMLSKVEKPTEI